MEVSRGAPKTQKDVGVKRLSKSLRGLAPLREIHQVAQVGAATWGARYPEGRLAAWCALSKGFTKAQNGPASLGKLTAPRIRRLNSGRVIRAAAPAIRQSGPGRKGCSYFARCNSPAPVPHAIAPKLFAETKQSMPEIQPFRGIRYRTEHIGELTQVVCPPYDIIDAKYQDVLYKRHPANVIRLELNREEPGDDETSNRYTRAAAFLRNWLTEGVLAQDPTPAVYVYHQEFTYNGVTYLRKGFMGRVRLERFGEGKIYPHEITLSGPKADRLNLTRACKTNISQIFGIYPDESNQAQALLESSIQGVTPAVCKDDLGVIHRVFVVSDPAVIAKVQAVMHDKPMYVADGHHRYETACNYRDEVRGSGALDADNPVNFVLTMLIGMNDPGLIVLPTHRLFRGVPQLDSGELIKRLGNCFTCNIAGEGADMADTIWKGMEQGADQGTIALYCAKDERWVVAKLTPAGAARMKEAAPDATDTWRSLGVALLHKLVVETLLEVKDLPRPEYVHLVSEVVEGMEGGEGYPLAALVMPATIEHIRKISEEGGRMPAKSTYFFPKLLSGLVFNPLT